MKNLVLMNESETKKCNGGGSSLWDVVLAGGRGCVNFGILLGNAFFRNNARYI